LLAERLGLLLEKGLQGALGEAGSGGVGDLFHGAEIDIESGSLLTEGVSGDDFAPLGGESAEFLEFLGGEAAWCHDASCLGDGTRTSEKRVPSD
jgi:hypothetical protein